LLGSFQGLWEIAWNMIDAKLRIDFSAEETTPAQIGLYALATLPYVVSNIQRFKQYLQSNG
jgi:hypothetical protein